MPGDPPPDTGASSERPRVPARPRAGPTGKQLLTSVSHAAWRSMTWPLEASTLLLSRSSIPSDLVSWRDSWLEATRWWTEAVTTSARLAPGADATLLAELAAGLMGAFRGRRVNVDVGGRSIRAVLDSIWLERHDAGYRGRIELRSVECDGLEVEELSVTAHGVDVAMRPGLALVMSHVELRGRSALEPLVAWLDPKLSEWSLSITDDRQIEWVRRHGGRRYIVHAAVCHNEVEMELRALRLLRATVRLPRWLRLTRKLPLPPLPGGMSISEARQVETGVDFRLSMPGIGYRFDLARVRQAIRSTGSPGSD
jgi:hypothetical protein